MTKKGLEHVGYSQEILNNFKENISIIRDSGLEVDFDDSVIDEMIDVLNE